MDHIVPGRVVGEVKCGTTRKAIEIALLAHDLTCLRHHQPPGDIPGSVTIAVPEGEEVSWAEKLQDMIPFFLAARPIMVRPDLRGASMNRTTKERPPLRLVTS